MGNRNQVIATVVGLLLCIALVAGGLEYQQRAKAEAAALKAEQKAKRQAQLMERIDQLLEKGELRKARRLIQEQYATRDPEIINAPALQQRDQALIKAVKAEEAARKKAMDEQRRAQEQTQQEKQALIARQSALKKTIDSARRACRKEVERYAREHHSVEFTRIEARTSKQQILMTLDWLAHKRYGYQEHYQSECTFRENRVVQLSVDDQIVLDQG